MNRANHGRVGSRGLSNRPPTVGHSVQQDCDEIEHDFQECAAAKRVKWVWLRRTAIQASIYLFLKPYDASQGRRI